MKKGASLPIETVIIMIIAVVVLLIMLMFITGKWANLTSIFGGLESQVGSSLNDSISIL
jgi:preprotein translocase subunit SecG